MTAENCRSETSTLWCLRVTAEADPSVLPRLLRRLQNLNLTPRRVVAGFGSTR